MTPLPTLETLELTHLNDGQVLSVTINRPKVLNALNEQVLTDLETVFGKYLPQSDIRAVVLQGAGDKAFVAGADIASMSAMNPSQALAFARLGQHVTTLMEALKQPIIAKVQGFALGGGCELAMACDIIVASSKAKFGQPEVGLGLIPGFGGTQRLVRRVGLPAALDILCAGRNVNGEEAVSIGLAARVVAADELDAEVNMIVKGILRSAPGAIAETKRLTRESYHMDLAAGLNAEATAFAARFGAPESQEGMRAFLEKRSASFSK